MTYRDDRDALKRRVEEPERPLAGEPGPNRVVWVVAAVPIVLALLGGLYLVFVRKPPTRGDGAPPKPPGALTASPRLDP